jgi:5-methylcytosine-specific restriction endonuclease McrA
MSARRSDESEARRSVREAVFERDGGCLLARLDWHRCGGPLTVHHLQKASQGGEYSIDNLVALCAVGNDWVEDNPEQAWIHGLVVRAGDWANEAASRRWLHGLVP